MEGDADRIYRLYPVNQGKVLGSRECLFSLQLMTVFGELSTTCLLNYSHKGCKFSAALEKSSYQARFDGSSMELVCFAPTSRSSSRLLPTTTRDNAGPKSSKSEQKKPRMNKKRIYGIISLSLCLLINASQAAFGRDAGIEVVSKVWVENGTQLAAVTINGDEVYRFKADEDADDAAEEAEDLAVRLQELLEKKFDPALLMPGRDDDHAIIKLDGQTVLSFDPLAGRDDDSIEKRKQKAIVFDAGLKLVNRLREVLGASTLPTNYPDLNEPIVDRSGPSFSGQASWYGGKFNGRRTSDGRRYDEEGMTAAHRTLPFGTKLLVMNRKTGQSCVVEVNDRGPFVDGRVIDLSRGAARQLNMLGSGVAQVDCLVLEAQAGAQ